MRNSFYVFENGLYHPQQAATAPWTRKHQNGTSVGGLLTREIERAPAATPLRLARITIELAKATPLEPTRVRCRVVRDGKRQQLLEAELLVNGVAYASAVGLRVREAEGPSEAPAPHGLPAPAEAPHRPLTSVLGEGHPMQTRIVKGARGAVSPGAYWTLFNADLVAGERTSATAIAVMACDPASGVSSATPSGAWQTPNVDLSVYYARAPQGEWILTDAEAEQFGEGFGLISSTLSDEAGPFGYAHQTLLYTAAEKRGW